MYNRTTVRTEIALADVRKGADKSKSKSERKSKSGLVV